MTVRVTLVSPAPTAATAAAAFPAGEPLDARGRAWAGAARGLLPRALHTLRGPERACAQTCAALGVTAAVDPALAGWDLGRWAGAALDDLARDHAEHVTAWLTDPTVAPHGGEPLDGLLARMRAWLAARPDGHTAAVCDGALVRAAIVGVLDAPAIAFWRVDVGPLSRTDLRGGPDRWTLRSSGAPLVPDRPE